jgi:hypothetical protein
VNSWKVILATVVIFGAGVMTGGLLVNYVQHDHPKIPHRPLPPAEPRAQNGGANQTQPQILRKEFVQQLDNALQLTPEQSSAIHKIIADGQEQNHAIWTNNTAQMHKVMQDVQRQIREQLTAAQQKQFADLLKQFRTAHRSQSSTNAPSVSSPATNPPPGAPGN